VIVLPLADIYSGEVAGPAVFLASATWLVGGASRYATVLAGRSQRQVERATAIGLYVGIALGLLTLITNEISHAV
jgi:hypothetical protein